MFEEGAKNIYYLYIAKIGKGKGIARFYNGTEKYRGVLEAKMKCDVDLVESYADRKGFTRKGRGTIRKILYTGNWENYARTLLYTSVIAGLKKRLKKIEATEYIDELDYFDLKYWTGIMVSRYHRLGYRGLLRPAKALRILLGIDRK